jgi:hypothetical protein
VSRSFGGHRRYLTCPRVRRLRPARNETVGDVPTGAEIVVVHDSGLATTILAGFGVALALLSLAWQAWSFRLTGSRVSVEVADGLRSRDERCGHNVARAVGPTQVAGVRPSCVGRQGEELWTEPDLSGLGRAAVPHHGGSLSTPRTDDPPLPFRLEGESERTWYYKATLAEDYAQTTEKVMPSGKPHTVRGRVELGGKKKPVLSKKQGPGAVGGSAKRREPRRGADGALVSTAPPGAASLPWGKSRRVERDSHPR